VCVVSGWRVGGVCMCVVSECACMCMRVIVVACVSVCVSILMWICEYVLRTSVCLKPTNVRLLPALISGFYPREFKDGDL